MSSLQIRARAELEKRRRQGSRIAFFDPDDPAEPERTIKERPSARLYCPEEADEEDLRAGSE
jgi:hypothetical protein